MRFGVSRYQPSVKNSAQSELRSHEDAIPVQGQNEETNNSTSDIGYLTLGVTSGANAIPLVGAEIVIEQNGALINQMMTNESGNSATVPLVTPNLEMSLVPGATQLPYATVNVYARFEGHYPSFYQGVQIFPEQISFLNVNMIPRPVTDMTLQPQSYIIPIHNLSQEGEAND